MNDSNNNQEQASKKTAHVAGKAAATYFGGTAGNQLYNLASNTKAGQEFENRLGKAINRVPGANKAAEKLNDSGALDVADKAVDTLGANPNALGGGTNSLNNDLINKNLAENPPLVGMSKKIEDSDNNSDNSLDSKNKDKDSTDSSDQADEALSLFKKVNPALLVGAGCGGLVFVGIFIIIAIVYTIFFAPIEAAANFIKGVWDKAVDFFSEDQKDLEEEFYQELKDVQIDMNKKYNVCIDVNLITATLTINRSFDNMLDEDQEIVDDAEEIENGEGETESYNYKKMKKNIRLLAKMQIINNQYSLDNTYRSNNGSYCKSSLEKIPVNSSNLNLFNGNAKDSSSFELIASNDKNGNWFTKRVNEETNYAYYLYYPQFSSDGTCTDNYANTALPKNDSELSIGTAESYKDSVYYWNIVNSFIEDYYSDELSDDPVRRKEQIISIADDIYSLYGEFGPSQTCSVSYSGPSSLCPGGITVEGEGTFDFEEYVAGVVQHEAYTSMNMEALKAQAVAARTYALIATDYCKKTITNSTNQQTFSRNISDNAREAANSTSGEILTYNGVPFSSHYDSFCYADSRCSSKLNSDGTYQATYRKDPNGEEHTIVLTDKKLTSLVISGHGHGMGMSQLYSYQLANEGYNYQEILKFFYSDGVEIELISSATSTDGAIIIQGPVQDYIEASGTTISAFNDYIYSQVRKAGLGTRNGVVSAATALTSGFYSQTGYILPYELTPSGKYTGYGIDSGWGTNTGYTSYPINGLDCSGFISWAIHNGGYQYLSKNAKGWGEAGNKREWFSGTTDNTAQPGDLIYNAPPNNNGTSGHIRMIIGTSSDGYIVAEASSGKNGVRVVTIPFTSTGPYYLVDMTDFYANTMTVSDYPQ